MKGQSPIEISEKVELFSNWIGDYDDFCESSIRITKRELDGVPTVFDYAMNEIFDPKVTQKVIPFQKS